MRSRISVRYLCIVLSVVAASGLMSAQQPRDPRSATAPGAGTIRGSVTAGDTGTPVRRAMVTILSSSIDPGVPMSREAPPGTVRQAVLTDNDGRYEVVGLPSGSYSVTAIPGPHRSSYQPASTVPILQGVPRIGPRNVVLGDGEAKTVDIVLVRAGAISGHVLDAFGDPLSRLPVTAQLLMPGSEPRTLATAMTDDRGAFRLFGLVEGSYLVVVDARLATPGGGPLQLAAERFGYPRTFAPGTSHRDEAARIRVGPGADVTIDVRLQEVAFHEVRGSVVNGAGEPLSGAHVTLVGDAAVAPAKASTSAEGRFVLPPIPAGEYQVAVNYTPPAPPDIGPHSKLRPPEFVLTRTSVNADGADLLLVTAPGQTFSGRIRFDEEAPAQRRVDVSVAAPDRRPFTLTPRIEIEGDVFTATGVFGPLLIRATMTDGATGRDASRWYLKAVLLDGRDISDVGTEFTSRHSGRVELLFSRRAASLAVSVVDESGDGTPGATIILFGEDESSWVLHSSMVHTIEAPDGRVTVRGVRPGRYHIAALPPGMRYAPGAGPAPELLRQLKPTASVVVLSGDEARSIDVSITRTDR